MSDIQRFWIKFIALAAVLLGLPLVGVSAAGYPVTRYLEFPPTTQYVRHAAFSWLAFSIFAFMISAVVLTLAIKGFQSYKKLPSKTGNPTPYPFPWWGWIGAAGGIVAWVLAWSRFSWFSALQPHTFSPLWFSYIVVVNALCVGRTGRSLMTDQTGFFLLLFPTSAAFWWFFEYLNRLVQNWYYVGVEFSPWAYFWYATLPFSTVLPAVLSTQQYFISLNWLRQAYGNLDPIQPFRPRLLAASVLLLSAIGLTGIGVWPNYLFPLLWVSPLLIIVCLQALLGERQLLSRMAAGDWSDAVAAALAALVCGGSWEMWNFFSLAKWKYSLPLVHRFPIFEMPLLGYAGYLPFGLECLAIGSMLKRLPDRHDKKGADPWFL